MVFPLHEPPRSADFLVCRIAATHSPRARRKEPINNLTPEPHLPFIRVIRVIRGFKPRVLRGCYLEGFQPAPAPTRSHPKEARNSGVQWRNPRNLLRGILPLGSGPACPS